MLPSSLNIFGLYLSGVYRRIKGEEVRVRSKPTRHESDCQIQDWEPDKPN
jgi:hypothetical protein